jgi:hypothetical protein
MARRIVTSLVVVWPYVATSVGRRSVEMRRAQLTFRQRNCRILSCMRTGHVTPGEVRQVALITAMNRGRRHSTAQAARGRCNGRELEEDGFLLHGHLSEAHRARRWEQSRDNVRSF